MATSASESAHQARSLKTDEEIVAIRYGIKVVEEHFGHEGSPGQWCKWM